MAEKMNQDNLTRLNECFVALSNRVNTEISTFWQRSNILLAVNALLLAFGTSIIDRDLAMTLALIVLGISSAILWLLVVIRGRAWLYFWENKLADIEVQLPKPHVFPGYWKSRKDRIKMGEPRPITNLILAIPIVMIILWIAILFRFIILNS